MAQPFSSEEKNKANLRVAMVYLTKGMCRFEMTTILWKGNIG